MRYSNLELRLLARFATLSLSVGLVVPITALLISSREQAEPLLRTFYRHADPILYLVDTCPLVFGIIGIIVGVREIKRRRTGTDQTIARLETAELIGEYGSWTFNLQTRGVTWSRGLFALLELDHENVSPDASLFMSFYDASDLIRAQRLMTELVSGEIETFDEQYCLVMKTGQRKHIRSKGGILVGGDGASPKTIVGTTRDITSLVQARELAKIADGALSRIDGVRATIVTCKHEINTPLAAAVASLQLLEQRIGSHDEIATAEEAMFKIASLLKKLEASSIQLKDELVGKRTVSEAADRLPKI